MRFLLFSLWLGVIASASAGEKHATLSVTCQVVAPAVSTVTYTRLPNNIVFKTVYY